MCDFDYMDGGEGQMLYDLCNIYEGDGLEFQCPYCGQVFSVNDYVDEVECPNCVELLELEYHGL